MRIRGMILFALIAVTGRTLMAVPTATVTKLTVTAGSVSTNAVAAGAVVTLSATVKVGTASVKPGLVRFCDASINAYCQGLANLGSAQIVSSKGKAALNVRLGLGTHMITAVFAGTSSYKGSVSAATSLEVQGLAGSTTALTVTPTDATGSYSLGATVTSMGAGAQGWPATGAVTFPDAGNGGKSLGSATLAAGSGEYGMR